MSSFQCILNHLIWSFVAQVIYVWRRHGQAVPYNTFKLQFKVKLKLKRGDRKGSPGGRTRLSSSLRLNWRLNVEMLPGAFLILAFNFQFKVKLEVKCQFQHFLAFMILAFKLQFRLKLELKLHMWYSSFLYWFLLLPCLASSSLKSSKQLHQSLAKFHEKSSIHSIQVI